MDTPANSQMHLLLASLAAVVGMWESPENGPSLKNIGSHSCCWLLRKGHWGLAEHGAYLRKAGVAGWGGGIVQRLHGAWKEV